MIRFFLSVIPNDNQHRHVDFIEGIYDVYQAELGKYNVKIAHSRSGKIKRIITNNKTIFAFFNNCKVCGSELLNIEKEKYENINEHFWAIVIDHIDETIQVVNDRFSSTEIYYYADKYKVLFFNDFKFALSKYGSKENINDFALNMFLNEGYIPAPYTIVQNIKKMRSSSVACLADFNVKESKYFLWQSILSNNGTSDLCYDHAKKKLECQIAQSISRKKNAEKAVVLLSSGIDSAYLATQIRLTHSKVISLTIGQDVGDSRYDESSAAKTISSMLGLSQEIKTITLKSINELVEYSLDVFPELFGDTAQFAVLLMASKDDDSVDYICGEGPDSLFYEEQSEMPQRMSKKGKEQLIDKILPRSATGFFESISRLEYEWEVIIQALVHKTRAVFDYQGKNVIFPYLDNEIIELCISLPDSFKNENNNKKIILRDLLNEKIPYDNLNLPKRGAGVPVYRMLKEMGKADLQRVASRDYIDEQGLFAPDHIDLMVKNFLAETSYLGVKLHGVVWRFYLFQRWYERYIK